MPQHPHLILHGAKTGNCLRAAIALTEAGLAFDVKRVNLRAGEQKSAAHLALNPAGKVPVLVEHIEPARVITQSSAIFFYADERAPGRLLPPPGAPGRVEVLEAFF